jgi:hypothetical protein
MQQDIKEFLAISALLLKNRDGVGVNFIHPDIFYVK